MWKRVIKRKFGRLVWLCLALSGLLAMLSFSKKEPSESHTPGHVGTPRTKHVSTKSTQAGNRVVSILLPPGRAGNTMFAFASLLGIARTNAFEAQLFASACSIFHNVFNSSSIKCNETLRLATFTNFREDLPGVYTPEATRIAKSLPSGPILLQGYFQSWKYFHHVADEIRRTFRFNDNILRNVSWFFRTRIGIRDPVIGRGSPADIRLIGVHVRRGDMATTEAEFHGYVAAPPAYIHNAMTYFQKLYAGQNIAFIVASDEIGWCMENIERKGMKVIFSGAFSTAEDMALLSMTDDVIVTSGTFGWWGAYLSGGRVVYYSKYPTKGSKISSMMSRRDYYLPEWVGLSETPVYPPSSRARGFI